MFVPQIDAEQTGLPLAAAGVVAATTGAANFVTEAEQCSHRTSAMSSAVAASNKRRVLFDDDREATSIGSNGAPLSDGDDEDDKLRQKRMREVMQQTQSMQPAARHAQSAPTADSVDSSSSSAPCTHSCPRCCPRMSSSARRITFPFLEGEWLLRPVSGRVAHAPTRCTAAFAPPSAALPSSYDSSIATVARSRLRAYLTKQLDCDQHVWPDNTDEPSHANAEDSMDWSQLVAGTAPPPTEQADSKQDAIAGEAAAVDIAALSSRERRKLKRKQERLAFTAPQQSTAANDT